MRSLPIVMLCCLLTTPIMAASSYQQSQAAFDVDGEHYLADFQEEAAEYRLERVNVIPDPAADAAARAAAVKALTLLDIYEWKDGGKVAAKAFKKYRYTASDDALAHLKSIEVISYARRNKVAYLREELARLWLFFPAYENVNEAMLASLESAEYVQSFYAQINLDVDDPGKVINIDGSSYRTEVTKIFRFLSDFGDRRTIGARADLGLARAELLGGNPKDMSPARLAYSDFLARHPRNVLTFTALCELALTHIVTYRGSHYDAGALINAAIIIDQAELVVGDDPNQAAWVAKFRARIRSWHQDRDLIIAQWYASRHRPGWLSWLKEPSDYNWDEPARFYFEEVIKRDNSSAQARTAERDLSKLPPSGVDPFRADLLPELNR